jgi:WD40 repeat protein
MLSLIASGTANGTIFIWDFEKCGFECKLEHPQQPEITSLVFLHPYPILCSADSRGLLMLWTVKPAPNKYHLIGKFENSWKQILNLNENYEYSADPNNAINCIVWHSESKTLCTGDEKGVISCWGLEKFFSFVEILPVVITRSSTRKKTAQYGESHKELLPEAYQAPKLGKSEITLLHQWKAHYSAITSLQLIEEPLSLLSASSDKRVRSWDLQGRYFGTLRQASQGGRWRFPLDEDTRKKDQHHKIGQIIESLEDEAKTSKNAQLSRSLSSFSPKTLEEEERARKRMTDAAQEQAKREIRKWTRKGMNQTKFAPNSFYESTKARIKTGVPELDKFSPNQPGRFPTLVASLKFQHNPRGKSMTYIIYLQLIIFL